MSWCRQLRWRSHTWPTAAVAPQSDRRRCCSSDADDFFREALGAPFVDYILRLKRYELDRFLSHVTDWEQTEYFEMY